MTLIETLRYNKFMDWLRGDSRSLKARFFRIPLEHLEFFLLYRLWGKTYTEFYSVRMSRQVQKAQNKPITPGYFESAAYHLDYLKSKGMRPDHRFLDYGCGLMRTGVAIMGYLEKKKYVGVDISEERFKRGAPVAAQHGFGPDYYTNIRISDCDNPELRGMTFDIIWSHDVFCHMPPEDCRVALRTLRDCLADDGQFFMTYSEEDRYRRGRFKDFWFTRDQARAMCEDAGYKFEIMTDWRKFQPDQVMVRLTKAAA
jgi:hypothetical protein